MLKILAAMSLVALLSLSPASAKQKQVASPPAPPVVAPVPASPPPCVMIEKVIADIKFSKILDDFQKASLDQFNDNYAKLNGGRPSPAVGAFDRLTVFGKDDVDFVVFVGSLDGCVVGHQMVPKALYLRIKTGPDDGSI